MLPVSFLPLTLPFLPPLCVFVHLPFSTLVPHPPISSVRASFTTQPASLGGEHLHAEFQAHRLHPSIATGKAALLASAFQAALAPAFSSILPLRQVWLLLLPLQLSFSMPLQPI